ncbi:hypothetical protein TWF718_003902 [Orbilia javanica]|uniref:Uncharacterized protein n=1 Tax=Orbilia javanica TaxID=47235 RepID=A0AAN8MWV8_9PEZI
MVLHKNKWDKRASKLHEKKLAQKDSKAAAEEKEKTLARAAARAGSRTDHVASATSSASSEASKWPTPGGSNSSGGSGSGSGSSGAQGETANTATATVAEGEVREPASQSESEDGDAEEGENPSRYSRRKKISSNAWRYEEPEPEPGEEPEEIVPEPDYVGLTRDKFQAIEEREQEREEIIDIWDHDSGVRRGRPDMDFTPKGNVVKVNRDDFKDVTEKIAKQATADRFRQRFATRKPAARSKDETINFNDHEDELDQLIGNMDLKGKRPGQLTEARSSKNIASTGNTQSTATKASPGTQHLDDDWLDDMLR